MRIKGKLVLEHREDVRQGRRFSLPSGETDCTDGKNKLARKVFLGVRCAIQAGKGWCVEIRLHAKRSIGEPLPGHEKKPRTEC